MRWLHKGFAGFVSTFPNGSIFNSPYHCISFIGLYDTVFDVDHDKERAQAQGLEPNGFNFDGADATGVDYALNRWVDVYLSNDESNVFFLISSFQVHMLLSWVSQISEVRKPLPMNAL